MSRFQGAIRTLSQTAAIAAPQAGALLGPDRAARAVNSLLNIAAQSTKPQRHLIRTTAAQVNAVSAVELHGSEFVQVERPQDERLSDLWANELCHLIPSEMGVALDHVRVCGTSGWLVTSSNSVIDDLWLDTWSPAQRFADEIISDLRGPAIHLSGTVLAVGTPYASNYYHWIMQVLPRLRHLHTLEALGGAPVDHIAGPQLRHPFQRESLRRLGVEHRYVEISAGSHLVAKRVVCSTIPTDNAHVRGDTIAFLSSTIGTAARADGPALLVTRASPLRPHLQQKKLADALESRGFELVCPGAISFSEQVRRFSTASMVVGVHGADLCNTVFSSSSTGLVELLPRNYAAPNFFLLARARRAPYRGVLGNEPSVGAPDGRIAAAALSIEPRDVLALIEQLT